MSTSGRRKSRSCVSSVFTSSGVGLSLPRACPGFLQNLPYTTPTGRLRHTYRSRTFRSIASGAPPIELPTDGAPAADSVRAAARLSAESAWQQLLVAVTDDAIALARSCLETRPVEHGEHATAVLDHPGLL